MPRCVTNGSAQLRKRLTGIFVASGCLDNGFVQLAGSTYDAFETAASLACSKAETVQRFDCDAGFLRHVAQVVGGVDRALDQRGELPHRHADTERGQGALGKVDRAVNFAHSLFGLPRSALHIRREPGHIGLE